ncbi:MAG: type II toxin-antitoxin system RelE/ParE family toxin [Candidatus Sungbacteria bacterium]|nr:type II toxin-antitoxin system RelE/ParE family toxin [Candidatus Sungbacteria bacterium]
MNWNAVLTEVAIKHLDKIPAHDVKAIKIVIQQMEENPYLGDIVKLGGENNRWRRRAGNYRLMYNILSKERIIFIYDIRRRTSNTY